MTTTSTENREASSQRISFSSQNLDVIGNLFLPADEIKAVAVVTGPLTSVKEQASGAYAKALADRKVAALAFDHRYFGESGGAPRQFENPEAKAEDIIAAVDHLTSVQAFKDLPVLGVGVCAGAGYMANAVVNDARVSGFAGIAGVYPDVEQTRKWMGDRYDAAIARALRALDRFQATGEAETIPAVSLDSDDVAMPLREAYDYYGTPRGAVPNYVNGFAVQSRLYTLPFDVQHLAERFVVPAIIVHSEHALAPSLARQFCGRLKVKSDVWLESVGQIDFYDSPDLIAKSVDAVITAFDL